MFMPHARRWQAGRPQHEAKTAASKGQGGSGEPRWIGRSQQPAWELGARLGTPRCRGRGMSARWSESTGEALLSVAAQVGEAAASQRIRRELKSVAGQRESEPGIVPETRRTAQPAVGKAGHFGRAGIGDTDEGMVEDAKNP